MKLLKPKDFISVHNMYDETIKYFPIITSVVQQKQQGYILIQNETYLIVHKFGFAYLLGNADDIYNFIQTAKQFLLPHALKLRIYDPLTKLKNEPKFDINKSSRIKYIYSDKNSHSFKNLDISHVHELSIDYKSLFNLDLCSRFWSNCSDFKTKSFGVVDKDLAGICYGAAVSDNFCEIDIYVSKSKRNKFVGTNLVKHFCKASTKNNTTPLWDCYTNNIASVKLAEKIGFKKLFEYEYYNI